MLNPKPRAQTFPGSEPALILQPDLTSYPLHPPSRRRAASRAVGLQLVSSVVAQSSSNSQLLLSIGKKLRSIHSKSMNHILADLDGCTADSYSNIITAHAKFLTCIVGGLRTAIDEMALAEKEYFSTEKVCAQTYTHMNTLARAYKQTSVPALPLTHLHTRRYTCAHT